MRRSIWIAGVVLAAVVVVAAGAWLLVDPNTYKAKIEQAVLHDTGRALTLGGPLHLRLTPGLTLVAEKVDYANPPGYSRPQMFSADEVRATVALLPLLGGRIHIGSLVLVHPDLLLERNAAGEGNWVTSKPASGGSNGGSPVRAQETAQLQDLQIEDGLVTWRDPRIGHPIIVQVAKLDAGEAAPDAPITLAMTGARNGVDFALSGAFGSLARLLDRTATTPWPVRASLSAKDATLAVDGSLTSPQTASGYELNATLAAPDLQAVAPLVPEWPTPSLHDLKFAATVADKSGMLLISDATLQAIYEGQPISLKASVGPYGEGKAVPVKVAAEGFGARFSAEGSASPPTGVDLKEVKFTSASADIAGAVTIGLAPRPSLSGTLSATRLDLDAIRASAGQAPASAPGPAPGAVAVKSAGVGRDEKLPFERLKLADGDVSLRVATLKTGGIRYTDLVAHVVLQAGRLRIEHAEGNLPGGHLAADLDIDASRQPPHEALLLHAPGLALRPLLTDLDLPDDASGVLEVDADLRGEGDSIHTIAERLDGHLGLAMVNGTLDNRLISRLIGPVLKSVRLPIDVPPAGGHSDIRCFAARLDASQGIAAVRAALLDVVRFRITAAGTIDLGDEMMALRLRPYVLLAGNGVVVPLLLTGPFAAPRVSVSPTGPVESVASLAASLLAKGSRLTPVTSALASTGEQLLGDADTGNCAPALRLARDGADGPQPPPPKGQKDNPVENLLRGLFK
jgi:uncharacterized protein involved in outer membrane biogenesis